MSSRLNKACADGLIKKLCTGVFAANDCTVEYKKPANSAAAKKAEREAQSAAVVEELAAQLAD